MSQTQSIPIACELPEDEQKRCADACRTGLFSHVEEVRARSEGYSLRFGWSPDRVRELGEFLALETSCCSFLDHSLDVPRGKQSIWLHLTGPDEAQDVLKQELEPLLPETVTILEEDRTARANRSGWGAFGAFGLGLAAVSCCVAPAAGIALVAAAGTWFVDSLSVLGIMGAVGFLAWAYSRRRRTSQERCCG